MKKIAFIINDLRIGGAERVLVNLSLGFPADWDIDIILNDASEIDYEYRGKIIDLGIIRTEYSNPFWYFFRVLMKRILILRRLKREKHYDACIGFADSANVANILSGHKWCKVVSSVHSNLTEASRLPEYKYVVCPLVKLLYRKSNQIVTVSNGIKRDLVHHFNIAPSQTRTIYNGCELAVIKEKLQEKLTLQEQEWVKGDYVVVTMGRLDTSKAQWHLIRAFQNVLNRIPEAKLLILGNGQHESYLKELSKNLGMENHIIFCGFYKNPFKILSKCHLFVFSSIYEGFGNVIIEAMECGLPIITTDFNSGAREIMAPDTEITTHIMSGIEYTQYGLLVPVCDGVMYTEKEALTKEEQILAEGINMLYFDKQLYDTYADRVTKRAKDFDTGKMVREWRALIESLNGDIRDESDYV